ncbi:hypothetical protein ACIQU6_41345 [Streptomyces sp. NPDC090442]|uniref:hypothetical protein n=1 Tax=Streptomyces sp. NPDC090442 TaxID=3365962 RepID=UPI0038133F24
MVNRLDHHDSECDKIVYEGGTCTCDLLDAGYSGYDDGAVYGEDPDPHDGRLGGLAMDW